MVRSSSENDSVAIPDIQLGYTSTGRSPCPLRLTAITRGLAYKKLRILRAPLDAGVREKLLNGWDDIELTLAKAQQIRAFESSRREALPWLYPQ